MALSADFVLPAAETAERLRAFLMASGVGHTRSCRSSRAAAFDGAGDRVLRAPAGLVDVRHAAPALLALPAPAWSDPELRFLVRPEVAERLQRAAEALPSDLRLGFWEGLRPLAVQRSLWDAGLRFLRQQFPERTGQELERALELFVARPDSGCPPHSTGSAVDVAPVDAWGRVLSPADAWGALGTELMARALREAGLASYAPEWWHWSYGDDEWARTYDCAPLPFASTPEPAGPGSGI